MASKNLRCCRLCLSDRELRNSHIIPESSHTPLYDDKHRMVTYSPDNPGTTGFLQKGLRERLLCEQCEQLINERYEKPFQSYWWNGRALDRISLRDVTVLDGIDYRAFKLFHLSVLFRAAASTLENFKTVQLPGRHYEQIRRMVLSGTPGRFWKYPIVATAVKGDDGAIWDAFIGPAHTAYLESYPCFVCTFAGVEWRYFVSSRRLPRLVLRIALTDEGTLPIARMPWGPMPVHRHIYANAVRRIADRDRGGTHARSGPDPSHAPSK